MNVSTHNMKEALTRAELWLGYIRAFGEMQTMAGWKKFEELMGKEEQANVEQLIDMKGDTYDFGVRQGCIKTLRHIFGTPKRFMDRKDDLEAEVQTLKGKLARLEQVGLADASPNVQEFIEHIHSSLTGAKT